RIGQLGNWDEEKSESEALDGARQRLMTIICCEVKRREIRQRQCEYPIAHRNQDRDANALDEPDDKWRHDSDDEGARAEHQSRIGSGIAVERLQQLRHQSRAAEENKAE